jgi:hypothetical protein
MDIGISDDTTWWSTTRAELDPRVARFGERPRDLTALIRAAIQDARTGPPRVLVINVPAGSWTAITSVVLPAGFRIEVAGRGRTVVSL